MLVVQSRYNLVVSLTGFTLSMENKQVILSNADKIVRRNDRNLNFNNMYQQKELVLHNVITNAVEIILLDHEYSVHK